MRKLFCGVLAVAVAVTALPPGAWAQLAVPRAAGVVAPIPIAPVSSIRLRLSPPSTASLPAAPSLSAPNLLAPAPAARPLPTEASRALAVASGRVALAEPLPTRVPAARATLPLDEAPSAVSAPAAPEPANAAVGLPAEGFSEAPAPRRAALNSRFAELRAAFGVKSPEALPEGVGAQTSGRARLERGGELAAAEKKTLPAPAAPVPSAPKGRGWLGFGTGLTMFLAAMAVEQVGNEAQGAAMPVLIAKVFGDVTISADLGIWSALSDFAGSLMAPLVIKTLGLKAAYLWTAGARLLTGALIAGFLAAGYMTVPALMAASVFGGFVLGINYTVEKSIPAVILQQDRAKLERFKAARQSVIEIVATVVPIITGAAVASLGFLPALVAFPLAAGLAMTIVALTLRIPQKAELLLKAAVPSVAGGFKGFWRSLTRGARVTLRTPSLHTAFWGYSLFYVTTPLLYWLVAPAYGLFVAGAAGAEHAALVQGVMLGLFSLGGLIASVVMIRENKRIEKLGEAAKRAALGRSLVRWMGWGTVSLGALAVMALPVPAWGALTLAALALIPFGLAQVVAKLKVESYFQSAAPADAVDDATAFMEGASMLVQMAVLWAAKLAFTTFTGLGPFIALAAAMIPFAAFCYWVTRRLARFQAA